MSIKKPLLATYEERVANTDNLLDLPNELQVRLSSLCWRFKLMQTKGGDKHFESWDIHQVPPPFKKSRSFYALHEVVHF